MICDICACVTQYTRMLYVCVCHMCDSDNSMCHIWHEFCMHCTLSSLLLQGGKRHGFGTKVWPGRGRINGTRHASSDRCSLGQALCCVSPGVHAHAPASTFQPYAVPGECFWADMKGSGITTCGTATEQRGLQRAKGGTILLMLLTFIACLSSRQKGSTYTHVANPSLGVPHTAL